MNTVSPGFAAEALTPSFGMGLDSVLRDRGDRFLGILNGIDPVVWDSAHDPALIAGYDRLDRSGKAVCRAALLRRVGSEWTDDGPVLAMIGRLDPQKGFDLLAAAAPRLLDMGARLIVIGTGDAALAEPFQALARDRPSRVALLEVFDRDLARQTYAGADLYVMPSRFEPCGQGQMIALRYGTPPIVRRTGGLADTVVDVDEAPDAGTGFVFDDATADALVWACGRAIALRRRRPGGVGPAHGSGHGRGSWLGGRLGPALPRGIRAGDLAAPTHSGGRCLRAAAIIPLLTSEPAPTEGWTERSRRGGPHGQAVCRPAAEQAGRPRDLAEKLASRGVDLRAIGGGSIGDSGHVILTTADDPTTKSILDESGYTYIEGESILAEVDDRPGGMARVARELADANINILGHLFLGRWGDRAMFAFVVDDPVKARPILERK